MNAAAEDHRRLLAERLGGGSPSDMSSGTLVVVPSLSFPALELRKIVGIQHYEERLLCLLLLLQKPDLRIVFVSSVRVDEAVIDYYLSFLPDPADARKRLAMVSLGDPAARALSLKLIQDHDALERARAAIEDPESAYLLTFNVTYLEWMVAQRLGVLLYGSHPDLVSLGSKSSSRQIARAVGVPILDGAEDLHSLEQVDKALRSLSSSSAGSGVAVIKLNHGFSGQGNAIVDLARLTSPLQHTPTVFCAEEESWATYADKIRLDGAIVEELARGAGVISPSVQMRALPDGTCEVISTHDQILGGPDDQVYLGCRFPARPDYRAAISEMALRVARELSRQSVVGSFGVDFVVLPDEDGWQIYLSEVNLRLGGTTHPFLMARFVTEGEYDVGRGELLVDGRPKHYVASDNLKSSGYVGLRPDALIAAVEEAGLAYDPVSGRGVLLHLLGALAKFGKLGAVCLADSPEQADNLNAALIEIIDELGRAPG